MPGLASQGVWDHQYGQEITVQVGGDRVEEMIRLHSTPVCNVKIQHVYREVQYFILQYYHPPSLL